MRYNMKQLATMCAVAALSTFTTVHAGAQAKPGATEPPVLAAPKQLTLPAISERTLPNGLRLVVIPHHELPIVNATLVVRTGSEADPAGKAGLATLTASLLDEGAGSRDAIAIAEQVAYLAVGLQSYASFDQSQVSLHTTRATLDSAFHLMADVALRPTFAQKEFDRIKTERLTSLLQEQDEGPAIANRVFASIVFGENHAYGQAATGTKESIERITRTDVESFWRSYYRPNNATLVIAGDITVADAERLAANVFGSWERAQVAATAVPTAPAVSATTIYLVDKPDAPQSSFRIGSVAVPRSTSDYYPLQVLNTSLGGSFTSRLNMNLRESKGYTYGAGTSFTMRRAAGPFTARAEIVREKSDSALIEFMKELNSIRTVMPADELQKATRFLQLGYAGRFETPADIASQVAALIPYDVPLASLSDFEKKVSEVTAADVQRVASKYIDPSKLAIVIVGDRAKIEQQIRALKLAPVELRDKNGRPIVTQ